MLTTPSLVSFAEARDILQSLIETTDLLRCLQWRSGSWHLVWTPVWRSPYPSFVPLLRYQNQWLQLPLVIDRESKEQSLTLIKTLPDVDLVNAILGTKLVCPVLIGRPILTSGPEPVSDLSPVIVSITCDQQTRTRTYPRASLIACSDYLRGLLSWNGQLTAVELNTSVDPELVHELFSLAVEGRWEDVGRYSWYIQLLWWKISQDYIINYYPTLDKLLQASIPEAQAPVLTEALEAMDQLTPSIIRRLLAMGILTIISADLSTNTLIRLLTEASGSCHPLVLREAIARINRPELKAELPLQVRRLIN